MSGGIELSCQPGKEGGFLVFPYEVKNSGNLDVYVMHAMPGVDRSSGEPLADPQAVVIVHGPDDSATLGRFVPPAPTDRRIAMPVIPLARHLAPGDSLESRIEVPLPFAETSPYFQDLLLRQYEIVDVHSVVLGIGYWVAGVDGLAAAPVDYAPGLFAIATRNTVRSAALVSRRFQTRALQLFRRTDQFPRVLPGTSDAPATYGDGAGSQSGTSGRATLSPAYA